ncbi:MAG: hypothetical protein KDC11_01590 [Chitinophagaceae bacterium]|nr:hypothetical protein [Chitinophagaceae bacterium]
MKNILVGVLIVGVLVLVACNTDKKPSSKIGETVAIEETPDVLEGKNSSYSLTKSRGDLLESLYKEYAENTPEIQELDKQINSLYEKKFDAEKDFHNYNNKNEQYYNVAKARAGQISDSLLADKVKNMIAKSISQYHNRIKEDTTLINQIEKQYNNIDDLYNVFKVVVTIPMIEVYQKNEHPSKKLLENFSDELSETQRSLEKEIEKH